MNMRTLALATAGALTLGGCAASHSLHPRPLVTRAGIHGLTRLQAHHMLAGYCTSNGYAIVHDSLSALACRKRMDGVTASYLAQPRDTNLETDTPVRTLHFRFVPGRTGVMRIQATASLERARHDGTVQHWASPLEDVQDMLRQAQRDAQAGRTVHATPERT